MNLNTLLLTGVLGLCGWTLYTVNQSQILAAAQAEKLIHQDQDLTALRIRLDAVEVNLTKLELHFAERFGSGSSH